MTESDIGLIERELAVTLPDSYKRALVPFKIRALTGNTEHQLWDDARALIDLNRKLRTGSRTRPAWPTHLFAVGDPHGDELIAIDLRTSDAAVWWLDHGMVDNKGSYDMKQSFAAWTEEFYRDTHEDMEGDGEDVDGEPKPQTPVSMWGLLRYLLSLVVVAVILFGGLLLIGWFYRWLKHH